MPEDEYHSLIAYARDRCGPMGIDKTLQDNGVDVIIGPGDGGMFQISGTAGESLLLCFLTTAPN